MVQLPPKLNKTAAAIYARYERDAEDWRRLHLGASLIGAECHRDLWYSFRWTRNPSFPGRILRLFERGQRDEEWIVEELRALGMYVQDRDIEEPPDENGVHPQYRFERFGGHFGGGCDGVVLGVLEAPKTWHLLEVKTSNARRFKELQNKGVRESNPKHYAQMQVYMHGLKLRRALYVCVNKDTDDIYTERVQYDKSHAESFERIAGMVIRSAEPLLKISEDPSWYQCKWCDHAPVCHHGATDDLERNCRTCASSTPRPDGVWWCDHYGVELDGEKQREGCDVHVFIPKLLPWEITDASEEDRQVTYARADGAKVVDHGKKLTVMEV